MTMKQEDIKDNEIRVIGGKNISMRSTSRYRSKGWLLAVIVLVLILGGLLVAYLLSTKKAESKEEAESFFEPEVEASAPVQPEITPLELPIDTLTTGYIQTIDTLINDIPLRIYIPHRAEMTLHVGPLDKQDPSIIYAAQAADIRRDNHKIVGAFVLKGKPLAWGLSKKGYCAIIDNQITIGVADNSPLFERATEKEGYFFRQYPLVDNGRLVENNPKNKSIRRSLCDRNGEIMMIESLSAESFHDFAQALVDLQVTNAIYLVGSHSFGWWMDENNIRQEFGIEDPNLPEEASYIVWRRHAEEDNVFDYKRINERAKHIVEMTKRKDKEGLSHIISYPLERTYPIPPIKNEKEFIERFDEVFCPVLIDKISNADLENIFVSWRGAVINEETGSYHMPLITFNCFYEDYDICLIQHTSNREKTIRNKLIEDERNDLHESLKTFISPVCLVETDTYMVRIDCIEASENNNVYRYASWEKGRSISDKPDLILTNGVQIIGGSGLYTHYRFEHDNYIYICHAGMWGCLDCNLELTIYKDATVDEFEWINGEVIVHQEASMIYWNER
ncbi:hypothetical protein M2480_000560 [Parabacteroides sp. PFB2-12]|nr:hypothetical protein [Parabacteroides sp. PM6-13]MDH6389595.1 hypothetical protein [Parabacteroides sp. PFB2-12]